ncbi:MAG: PaaI family thioesterase [Tissierellia bacterium]|nr:PaaI family thioesterase [Tissierellia bacterium]
MTKNNDLISQLLEEEATYAKGGFIRDNNIRPRSFERDNLVLELPTKEKHNNGYGVLHGAVMYLLADTAAGILCLALDQPSVTLSSNINFISNVSEGSIFSSTRIIHKGGKTSVIEVTIHDGKANTLAVGIYTMYRIHPPNGRHQKTSQ